VPKKADIREVHKYADLLQRKLDIDDELKGLKAQLTALEPHVLDYFQRQGISQVAGKNRVLYLRREVHTSKSKDVTTEQACAKLQEVGLPDYVGARVNIQGLSAHVRELEAEGQDLQLIEEQFGGAFHVVELFKIGSRKK